MPIITWDETYSVGVERIDAEHKRLIAMINKAYDAAETMDDKAVLSDLIEDMVEYATTHFSTESDLMKQYKYPGREEHLLEHSNFTAKAVISGTAEPSDEWRVNPIKIFQFLAEWLKNHILETDKELGAFLNEQGVK